MAPRSDAANAAAAPKRPRPAEGGGRAALTIENLKKLKRLARLRAFIDLTEGPSLDSLLEFGSREAIDVLWSMEAIDVL